MKYKTILLLFILSACSPQLTTLNKKEPYAATGFAYIYNELDFNKKIIKRKMNNDNLTNFSSKSKNWYFNKNLKSKNKESLSFKKYKKNKISGIL